MLQINRSDIDGQISDWLDVLDGLLEENIMLKHRLSDIVIRRLHSKCSLEILEAYQNSFINKDAYLSLLRQDIRSQQKLASALLHEGTAYYSFMHKQQKLQYDVAMMQAQFSRLKDAFEAQFPVATTT